MGYARWNPSDWTDYVARGHGKHTDELFARRGMHPALDPFGVGVRESRDSELNPCSTGIVVALDVTGSMGMLADAMAREGLGTLVEEILHRRPVSDPHTMIMGVGDAACDQAPLQATQFEADIRIAEQLSALWLEKGGGGNDHESYHLPWYFAAMHTGMDCWEKRGRKGYLFTVGDEDPPGRLLASQVRRVTGDRLHRDLGAAEVLRMAQRSFHVFHLVVEEGSYAARDPDRVASNWTRLLGERTLRLADHRRMAEVIVSAIAVSEGAQPEDVAGSWPGAAAGIVRHALLPGRTAPRRFWGWR